MSALHPSQTGCEESPAPQSGSIGQLVNQDNDPAQLKLIVTVYAKSRTDPSNHVQSNERLPPTSTEQPQDKSITDLLSEIIHPNLKHSASAPALKHLRTTNYTPHITQSTYLIPTSTPPFSTLRHHPSILTYETTHNVEIIFDALPSPPSLPSPLRPLKLALFDMDSTLIDQEVIDELARTINITPAVSAITARAMNGEIDFATSLQERVAMLQGVRADVWEELKATVTIAKGARELVAGLKERGVVTGVISGGFQPMAEWLRGELGLDVAVANHLLTRPASAAVPWEHLSGRLDPGFPIVTPERKRDTLLSLAAERGIPLCETLAVGDGSNDLLMLGAAGLGVAWNAKERVQKVAPMRLNGVSMADLLYLLGDVGEW